MAAFRYQAKKIKFQKITVKGQEPRFHRIVPVGMLEYQK